MSTTTAPLPASALSTARLRALVRGRADDPRWVRPALLGVIALAALLCLWDLTVSGYSNTYYAAAAKAGSESWKAWFFGALDPGSFITVDKPPLSLWLMGLSARAFGFSQLQHPAAAGALHDRRGRAAVRDRAARVRACRRPARRRGAGAHAGRPSRSGASTTPTRCSCCCWWPRPGSRCGRSSRAARSTSRWAGVVVGLAFMTKMLQGWMVVPALAAAYALAGPARLRRGCAGCSWRARRWSRSAPRGRWPSHCGRARRRTSAAARTARPGT